VSLRISDHSFPPDQTKVSLGEGEGGGHISDTKLNLLLFFLTKGELTIEVDKLPSEDVTKFANRSVT
jgi:hypothetical protein